METLVIFALLIGSARTLVPTFHPSGGAGIIGDSVKLSCQVPAGIPNLLKLAWNYDNHIVYIYENGEEDYPMGTDKYLVEQDGEKFTLTVIDIQHSDSRQVYNCIATTENARSTIYIPGPEGLENRFKYLTSTGRILDGKLVNGKWVAEKECKVVYGTIQTVMWEFNNKVVYSYQNGKEEYPLGKDKYSVKRDVDVFQLTVSNLNHQDTGTYNCFVTALNSKADLVVLESVALVKEAPNSMEGSVAACSCEARFGGPSKADIAPSRYPQLQMLLGHSRLNGTVIEREPQGPQNYYIFKMEYNITLNSAMDGQELKCELKVSDPKTELTDSLDVTVYYPARNLNYTPNCYQCVVGTVVNCTAEGNPQPSLQWVDTSTAGRNITGGLLQLTNEMIGMNVWKCTAINNIYGKTYEEDIMVVFEVIEPPHTGSDDWKIIVGVLVPVAAIIIAITVFVLVMKHGAGNGRNGKNATDNPCVMDNPAYVVLGNASDVGSHHSYITLNSRSSTGTNRQSTVNSNA